MPRRSPGFAIGFRFISSSPWIGCLSSDLLIAVFLVSFIVDLQGKYFAEGCGRSKKEAKNASAKVLCGSVKKYCQYDGECGVLGIAFNDC